ncbi:MAG: hypothetical protein AAFZ87_09890 [Planctomycetota bacterium]
MHLFHHAARASVLAASVALASCGGGEEGGHDHDGHDHGGHVHAAQFGGTVVELGDHYANLEYKHDSETGNFELWTMDAHNESPVKSPTESVSVVIGEGEDAFTIELQPEVSASMEWAVGSSAHFEGSDQRLLGMDVFHATVTSVSVRGQVFEDVLLHVGHAPHGDDDHEGHDHDHDGEDHEGHDHGDGDGDDSEG